MISPAAWVNFLRENRLESLAEELDQDKSGDGGDDGDFKVGDGQNIFDCRGHAPFLTDAGAFEFSHQEIGIKEEDDETHLDHRSPDMFFHSTPWVLVRTRRRGSKENGGRTR